MACILTCLGTTTDYRWRNYEVTQGDYGITNEGQSWGKIEFKEVGIYKITMDAVNFDSVNTIITSFNGKTSYSSTYPRKTMSGNSFAGRKYVYFTATGVEGEDNWNAIVLAASPTSAKFSLGDTMTIERVSDDPYAVGGEWEEVHSLGAEIHNDAEFVAQLNGDIQGRNFPLHATIRTTDNYIKKNISVKFDAGFTDVKGIEVFKTSDYKVTVSGLAQTFTSARTGYFRIYREREGVHSQIASVAFSGEVTETYAISGTYEGEFALEAGDTIYIHGHQNGSNWTAFFGGLRVGLQDLNADATILPPNDGNSYVTIDNANQIDLVDYTNNGDINISGRDITLNTLGLYRVNVRQGNSSVIPNVLFKGEDIFAYQDIKTEYTIVDIRALSDTITFNTDKDGQDIDINGTWLEIEYLGLPVDLVPTQYESGGSGSLATPQNFSLSNDTGLYVVNSSAEVTFSGGILTAQVNKVFNLTLNGRAFSTNGTTNPTTLTMYLNGAIEDFIELQPLNALEERDFYVQKSIALNIGDEVSFGVTGDPVVFESSQLSFLTYALPPDDSLTLYLDTTRANQNGTLSFDRFVDATPNGELSAYYESGILKGFTVNKNGRYSLTKSGPRSYDSYNWGDYPYITRNGSTSIAGLNSKSVNDYTWEFDVKKGDVIKFTNRNNITARSDYYKDFYISAKRIEDYRYDIPDEISAATNAVVLQGAKYGWHSSDALISLVEIRDDFADYKNGEFVARYAGQYIISFNRRVYVSAFGISYYYGGMDILVNGEQVHSFGTARNGTKTISLSVGDVVTMYDGDNMGSVAQGGDTFVKIEYPEIETPAGNRLASFNRVIDNSEEVYLSIYEMDFEKSENDGTQAIVNNGNRLLRDYTIGEILGAQGTWEESSSDIQFEVSKGPNTNFLIDYGKALYVVRRLKYQRSDGSSVIKKDVAFIYDWEETDNSSNSSVTFFAFGKTMLQWALLQTNIDHVIVDPVLDTDDETTVAYKESQIQKDAQNKDSFVYPVDMIQYRTNGLQFKQVVSDIFNITLINPTRIGNGKTYSDIAYDRQLPNMLPVDVSQMVTSFGIDENIDAHTSLWEAFQTLTNVYGQDYAIELILNSNELTYYFEVRPKGTFALDLGSNRELTDSYRFKRTRSASPLLIYGHAEGITFSDQSNKNTISNIARPLEEIVDNKSGAGNSTSVNSAMTLRTRRQNEKDASIKLDISFAQGNKTYLGDIIPGDKAEVSLHGKIYKMEFIRVVEQLSEFGINFIYELENR